MTEHDQLSLTLNTLTLKKEYLFNKLQKLYDKSKDVKFESLDSVQRFLVQYSDIDELRSDFEKIITDIIRLELQINPDSKTNMNALDSFDDLYYACKKVAFNCNRLDREPTPIPSNENKCEITVRPLLPKIKLFEFDGNIEHWTTFYDTFLSLVHNNNFNDIDKFHYLLSCVKGPALNIVKSLPITANNYAIVWQNLLDKYHDKRALTGRYLDRMLGFTPLTKDTIDNLTSFIETFDHSLKVIHALQVDNLDDYLFCHIALRGLDSHTRKLFEESRNQNVLPTFAELIDFVNKQIKVLEHTFPSTTSWSINENKQKSPQIPTPNKYYSQVNKNYNNNSRSSQPSPKVTLATSRNDGQSNSNYTKLVCMHCNLKNHLIYRCEQFRKLPVNDRVDRVNVLKLCSNCLKSNHNTEECQSNLTCGVCTLPHHYLLHRDTSVVSSAVPSQSTTSHLHTIAFPRHSVSAEALAVNESFHSVNETANYGVVLGTTRAHVIDIAGQYQNCRAVLDSGAQSSFITLECAQRLGLPRSKCPFSVAGLGGEVVKNYGIISCKIKSCKSDVPIFTIDMVVVAKVSSEMPNVTFSRDIINKYECFELADPLFYVKSSVDMLLGNDVVSELMHNKTISIESNIPNVIETVFGFVVSGKLYYNEKMNLQNYHSTICQEPNLDNNMLRKRVVEELPCKPVSNPIEQLAEDSSGQHVVPLTCEPEPLSMVNSRVNPERRLLMTELQLSRYPVLQQAYDDYMPEYLKVGHVKLYTGSEPSKYLIPHHSILRSSSSSTVLRVVFGASANITNNLSFNEIHLPGPNLYRDIVSIIIPLGLVVYCFASDICKIYRTILIRLNNCKYQHIILYKSTANESIKTYKLKPFTYGVSSDEGERFPLAANIMRKGVYKDYILWSCETFSHACTLQDGLIELCKSGGVILMKWLSLLSLVPLDYRESKIKFYSENRNYVSVELFGLQWSLLDDMFSFSVSKLDRVTTIKSLSKILVSIDNSVGFILSFTFTANFILHDYWKLDIDWDVQLPADISEQWLDFIYKFLLSSNVHIERKLIDHGDPTSHGYSSCFYIISRSSDQVKCYLLILKPTVAPVKYLTISWLELMVAVLLRKRMKYVYILSRVRVRKKRITSLTGPIILAWFKTEVYELMNTLQQRYRLLTLPPIMKVGDVVVVKIVQTHCNWQLTKIYTDLNVMVRKVILQFKGCISQTS